MIKTIKVKKQMRLDELIKYVWDNAIYPSHFESHAGFKIHFDSKAGIKVDNDYVHSDATVFTVEEEEEVTEDAPFEDIVILHINGISHLGRGAYHSIRSIRRDYPTVAEIHTLMNGKLQLIWEAE